MAYKKIVTTLPFNTKDLYNLIVDIKKYPEFLPHCSKIDILEQSGEHIIAEMQIEYATIVKAFSLSYTSYIILKPENYTILITNAQETPFKKFQSSWALKPSVEGTQINYEIMFELHNPILNVVLSSLLLKNAEMMVNAFTKRAKTLLG